jgi:transglutaminase-like putative cysteine protease
MRYCYFLMLMVMGINTFAQQKYEVSLIPKDLLSHAEAVIRANETTIEVKGLDAVSQHIKYVVTILNKNGDREAAKYLYYNKSEQIRSVKGNIYDEFGKLTNKILERDFEDRSATDGFSLFLDDRYKYFRPAVTNYPYTVEYDYELYSKQTLFLPDWDPNPRQSTGVSVEHSSYKFTCKPDFDIRYKALNNPGEAVITTLPLLKTYRWEISHVKAWRDEPYSPTDDKIFPSVKIAPEKFSYAGVSGSFTNWEEYGRFIYDKLLKNRDKLPPETAAYVKSLTDSITDPKLKAKKIYEYMQQKTRYVSVQIGIGGYQPFTATEVDQSSYGDCKALVNYTQSLLRAVGIESYYVLNMAGRTKQSAITDFASMNQFNHVILCLPFKNDTTWIDCTSKENPFGYLGDFTDDRIVLACTPMGGKLMRTPQFAPSGNTQARFASFTITPEGELEGEMKTEFKGTQYDNRYDLMHEAFTEQVKKIKEIYSIENLDIQTYNLTENKSIAPIATETIKLRARDYMSQNGNRYFFTPNTASRYIKPLKNVMNRSTDVYINRGYWDTDEITYNLPEGFDVKIKPLLVSIDKPFGKYTASTRIDGHKLIYRRSLQINSGTYNKDTYGDLVDFYQDVYDADHYTVTIEKVK